MEGEGGGREGGECARGVVESISSLPISRGGETGDVVCVANSVRWFGNNNV